MHGAVKLVGKVLRPDLPGHLDRARRKNAHAVELTAAPEHFGETREIGHGRCTTDMRRLDIRILEQGMIPFDGARQVLDRHRAAHVRFHMARLEIAAQAHARAGHAERFEQILMQYVAERPALGSVRRSASPISTWLARGE